MRRRRVNYYYDNTWVPGLGGKWTSDTEGNLVLLCDECARKIPAGEVDYAQNGDDVIYCECEYPGCRKHN